MLQIGFLGGIIARMKRMVLGLFAALAGASTSFGIITYGESNSTAAVKYDGSGTAAEYSVVFVEPYAGEPHSASGVYLGNGWFLTANHVNAPVGGLISQNGATSRITYVDNTLNSTYGVDLKMFYVSDLSDFEYLTPVNLSAGVFDSLSGTSFAAHYSVKKGYYVSVSSLGTYLQLVGAGYGSAATTDTPDANVGSDETLGAVHSGESSIFFMSNDGYIVTLAETKTASAKAMNGDSGGGMFFHNTSDDEWYLVGTLVSSSVNLPFGAYTDMGFIYNSSGQPTAYDYATFQQTYSTSASLNLQSYVDDINAIASTTPVPEPSVYAAILGLAALAFAFFRRK